MIDLLQQIRQITNSEFHYPHDKGNTITLLMLRTFVHKL